MSTWWKIVVIYCPLRKLFNLPWGLFSCKIASKSSLSIFASASSRVFTVICGQKLPTYSNSCLVGLCVERLSNSLEVVLGTPSSTAKLRQFAKVFDCTSSSKAISSKRLPLGEKAAGCFDVIALPTNLKSARAAAKKDKIWNVVNYGWITLSDTHLLRTRTAFFVPGEVFKFPLNSNPLMRTKDTCFSPNKQILMIESQPCQCHLRPERHAMAKMAKTRQPLTIWVGCQKWPLGDWRFWRNWPFWQKSPEGWR